MIRGSCLCGGVTFQVTGPVLSLSNCHCSRCRKAYGSAFGTIAVVKATEFAFTSGLEFVRTFPGGRVDRPFCATCGSRLPLCVPGDPVVGIPAGLLDDDPGVRPGTDIFVGSKAPWWDIGPGTQQHVTWPPGFVPNPPWDPSRFGH